MSLRVSRLVLILAAGLVLLLFSSIYLGNRRQTVTRMPPENQHQNEASTKTQQMPDYTKSVIPTTVEDFLITIPIPIPEQTHACGVVVYPQRQFTTLQSLQAGLAHTSLMLASPETGAPACLTVWIAVAGQEQGFHLNEGELQDWVRAENEYGYSSRLLSSQIADPNDWVAGLWRKTIEQRTPLPDALKAYSQDDGVHYYLHLGALPAKALDDPQWNQALLAKQTADPLAEQKITLLRKCDSTLILVEDDLSFRLRRLNASYSIDDFHASVTVARQIESIVRSAKTSAVSGNLETARAQLLRGNQLEEELSRGVRSFLHKNPTTD
jgi:hypothetical protein